jgi:alkyl hydroperoxide reductase subunit AhpF
MEKMLDENVQKQVREFFKQLKNPVGILFFGSDADHCEYCEPTLEMLKEIAALNELLSVTEFDITKDADQAKKYHVERTPGIVLVGKVGEDFIDYGIHLSGIPSGHEFSTLIHDMMMVSKRETSLSPATKNFLRSLEKPVHLQVFVTPT